MGDLDLKRLKAYGDSFVKKLIYSNKASYSEFISTLIESSSDIDIKDYEYYFPQQIRFLDVVEAISDDNLKSFCVSLYGSIVSNEILEIPFTPSSASKKFTSKENKKFGFVMHIEVSFIQKGEDEIDIMFVDLISNFYKTDSDAFSEWSIIKDRIIESKKNTSKSRNSNLLEKIDAIEIAEDLMKSIGEDIDDDLFLEKVEMLQKVANVKYIQKVFYEYNSVSKITNQPVLMNKSNTIFLTKEQVVGLISDLSSKYRKRIENTRTGNIANQFKANNYIVPIVFGNTERGHADPNSFEIVLPKLGDWRTGYKDLYTSEVVFHEFAHVIDFGRKSTIFGKATFDVHRHDFVDILDEILLEYKDWINKNYNPQLMRDMIINMSSWLNDFNVNYEERIKSIKQQEQNRLSAIKEDEQKSKESKGVTENSYPINILFENSNDLILKYLLKSIESSLSKSNPDYLKKNLLSIRIKILDFMDGINDSITLNKSEITDLVRDLESYDAMSYVKQNNLSDKNFESTSVIKEFKTNLEALSTNKTPAKTKKEKIVIEDYKIEKLDDLLSKLKSL